MPRRRVVTETEGQQPEQPEETGAEQEAEPEEGAAEEAGEPQDPPPAAEAEQVEESEEGEEDAEEEGEEAEPKGPLSELQGSIRELLDFDQITEIRHALQAREDELEKHLKKGSQLGVYEEDARRRLRLITGSDTRFGLTRIFAREEVTETRDLFFDREKPNGRPAKEEEPAEPEQSDEPAVFRIVGAGGEHEVECTEEELGTPDVLYKIRALHTVGRVPEEIEAALRERELWHLVEDKTIPLEDEEEQPAGEEPGRELAEASGISA